MQQSFTSRESRAGERNGSEMDAGTGRAQDPPPGSLRVDLNVYFLFFLFFLFFYRSEEQRLRAGVGACFAGDGGGDGGRSRRPEAPRRPGHAAETSPCNLEEERRGGKGEKQNRKHITK